MTTFLIDECVSFLTVKLIQECGFQWEMVGNGIIVMRVSDLNSIISGNRVFKVLLNREKSFEKTLFIVNSIKYRKRK